MMKRNPQSLWHVVTSFGATGAQQVLGLFVAALAAILLSPAGRGDLAAVMLLPIILSGIASLSLDQSVAYYGATQGGSARRFAALALIVSAPLALGGVVFGYFLIPLLMQRHGSEVVAVSRLYLLFIPLNITALVTLGAAQGLQRFTAWNALRIIPVAGYVIAILAVLLVAGTTVQAFALASLFGVTLAALVGIFYVASLKGLAWRPLTGDTLKLTKYAGGVHVAAVAALATANIDKLLIAIMLPSDQLGIYVVAFSIAFAVRLIGTTLAPLTLARVASQQTGADRIRVFGRYFRLTTVVTVCVAVIFALIGDWFVIAVFGELYRAAGDVLPLLLIGSTAMTIRGCLYAGLRAHSQLKAIRTAEYAMLVSQATALALLLPGYGIRGAALAVALSGLVGMGIAARAMSRVAGRSIFEMTCPKRDDVRYILAKIYNGRAANEA